MFISVFDLFKVGIGPSSSHTVGPMVASNMFLEKIAKYQQEKLTIQPDVFGVKVHLHGSLAFTGKGHATDVSVILGLDGEKPEETDPDERDAILAKIMREKHIYHPLIGTLKFDPAVDLIFNFEIDLKGHPNGLIYEAYDNLGNLIFSQIYYSVGGGFVVTAEELEMKRSKSTQEAPLTNVPYPFNTAVEMLQMAKSSGLTIAQMKRANELCFLSEEELNHGLDHIWDVMNGCLERGLRMDGELPGGLHVKRRAKYIKEKLKASEASNNDFIIGNYLSLYAIAVNEENASGGRIVTAPTNGAAGVIPAVIKYYLDFYADSTQEKVRDFLLTSSAIGGLLKVNASISGAEVGCQGEVGSASSMAAAGFTAVLGGSPEQIENAAEIALEHHLGLTCDPVAGLVQVPCIERNAMGAIKAVSATSLAMLGDGTHFVSLDACIKTMKETGLDMSNKYKETSLAGLAVNVVNC